MLDSIITSSRYIW